MSALKPMPMGASGLGHTSRFACCPGKAQSEVDWVVEEEGFLQAGSRTFTAAEAPPAVESL